VPNVSAAHFWGLRAPQRHGSHGRGWVLAGSSPRRQHPSKPRVLDGAVPVPGASPQRGAAAPLSAGHHGPPAPLHGQPHRHLRVGAHGRGRHRLGFGGKVSVTSPPACGGMLPNLVAGKQNQKEKRWGFFPLEQLKMGQSYSKLLLFFWQGFIQCCCFASDLPAGVLLS